MELNNKNLFTQKELIKRINQTTRKQKKLLEILVAATPVSVLGDKYDRKYKG